jgi:hypothetical protein
MPLMVKSSAPMKDSHSHPMKVEVMASSSGCSSALNYVGAFDGGVDGIDIGIDGR